MRNSTTKKTISSTEPVILFYCEAYEGMNYEDFNCLQDALNFIETRRPCPDDLKYYRLFLANDEIKIVPENVVTKITLDTTCH
jgi:hypothetical protein